MHTHQLYFGRSVVPAVPPFSVRVKSCGTFCVSACAVSAIVGGLEIITSVVDEDFIAGSDPACRFHSYGSVCSQLIYEACIRLALAFRAVGHRHYTALTLC